MVQPTYRINQPATQKTNANQRSHFPTNQPTNQPGRTRGSESHNKSRKIKTRTNRSVGVSCTKRGIDFLFSAFVLGFQLYPPPPSGLSKTRVWHPTDFSVLSEPTNNKQMKKIQLSTPVQLSHQSTH